VTGAGAGATDGAGAGAGAGCVGTGAKCGSFGSAGGRFASVAWSERLHATSFACRDARTRGDTDGAGAFWPSRTVCTAAYSPAVAAAQMRRAMRVEWMRDISGKRT